MRRRHIEVTSAETATPHCLLTDGQAGPDLNLCLCDVYAPRIDRRIQVSYRAAQRLLEISDLIAVQALCADCLEALVLERAEANQGWHV